MSGLEMPVLGYGLMALAVLLLIIPAWGMVRRVRVQAPIRLGPKYIEPTIGGTRLERHLLRSLYMNNYFISNNQKTDESETFSVRVIPPFRRGIPSSAPFNLSQSKSWPNILAIHGGLTIMPAVQKEFGELPTEEREQILAEIGRELNLMGGIEVSGINDPLTEIHIQKNVILSRTTDDSFYVEELLSFIKAISTVTRILNLRLHTHLPNLQ